MGAMLGGGHDVPVDRLAAQGWFIKAAEKGHAYGLLMLGRYLARGLAGQTDVAQARVLLEHALKAGVAEAEKDLAALSTPVAQSGPVPQMQGQTVAAH